MFTPAQSTPYQALYRACMKEAAVQGHALMKRLVVGARTAMPKAALQLSDPAQRRVLTEAARIMMKHEQALCSAYPQALLTEFARAIAGDTGRTGALSFDSLERLGEDQVDESVELERTQQRVMKSAQAEFETLNALVGAVQGLAVLPVDRNPLRPETYVRSLRTVALQSPVSRSVRLLWMQHWGDALGAELARVYRQLSDMLRKEGVSIAPSAAGGASLPAGTPEDSLLNVQGLRRLLAGEFDAEVSGPAAAAVEGKAADFASTVPAAFEPLREMKQIDQVMQRVRQSQAAGAIDASSGIQLLRRELRNRAGPGQALGLEVVTLMVENIASDLRLLAPVQRAVRDLEPALLRLALTDPRFFSDRKHPARQLLEEVTQRSMAWEDVDAPGFAGFMEPLEEAVEALLTTRVAGAGPFDYALHLLEQGWGELDKGDGLHRETAVRVLLQAEQRNLLADRIAREFQERADVAGAPREVVQFVVGPWAQVMAQARLADQGGAADPRGYGDCVSDLILSVQPRLGPGNAVRLARLVPPLLKKLREGLLSIDYPPAPTKRFLEDLDFLHQQAVLPPAGRSRPAMLSDPTPQDKPSESFEAAESTNSAWLAPGEARHSGFMESHPNSLPDSLPQTLRPKDPKDLEPALPKASLQPGAWVEISLDGQWRRYLLAWASPHGTLFMFTGTSGKTQSMSRQLLDQLLQEGLLRMVSGQAVVDGALDAVAQAAARNSVLGRL